MPEPFDIRHLVALLQSLSFVRHDRSRLKLTTKDTKDTKNLRLTGSHAEPGKE